MNPYEVLGVARNANDKTIKSAYRKLGRKWHPDAFQDEVKKREAEIKFKEINEAYDILKTAEKRAAYDAENPVSVNIYEYYAEKKTSEKTSTRKKRDSADIEEEKQRQAILQFLQVEYGHKDDILDMFVELATGALNGEFSDEDYIECLNLIFGEVHDCISKIEQIIKVAKKKSIKGFDFNLTQAQDVINELTEKKNETPKTLKEALYIEETRILTEKVNNLMKGLKGRLKFLSKFNLLYKTWEFSNDSQLNSIYEKHQKQVEELLSDVRWIQKVASERKIPVGLIDISFGYGKDEITFAEYEEKVKKCAQVSKINLQQLREKFWKEECAFLTDEQGGKVLHSVSIRSEKCRGTFICPPYIKGLDTEPFYWLRNIEAIVIPINLITHKVNLPQRIILPQGSLKRLIIDFGEHSKVIDVSDISCGQLICVGNYICIKEEFSGYNFILVDEENVYVYDYKKLCELNGVTKVKQLEEKSKLWRYHEGWGKDYNLQVHLWAQLVKKLPDANIMRFLPASTETIKKWLACDKTNFENAFQMAEYEYLKLRVIRLYIGLGALNNDYCHAQAECLISKLDVSKMYRSRLERFNKVGTGENDPMFFIPKEIVDFVQENIKNEQFLPYVIVFLDSYKMFLSEAKKAKVGLSTELIIANATKAIFHCKVDSLNPFVKQLLKEEKEIEAKVADEYLHIYNIAQRQMANGMTKNIIETVDKEDSTFLHYRYFDMESLQSYNAFRWRFEKDGKTFYNVEVENVFLSSNTHAIEILDVTNMRMAIVILNLFDKGELFADIVKSTFQDMEVLEVVRRALIDQAKCNNKVTAISIGTNEAPRTTKYNKWRDVLRRSKEDWVQQVEWIKFEYLFKCKPLSTSYKGYRARFILGGKAQDLAAPNPYDDPKIRRMLEERNSRINRYW